MIAARDYSNCPDPAAAMRADALARKARMFPANVAPAPIRKPEPVTFQNVEIIKRVDDEEIAKAAKALREAKALAAEREALARAEWDAMLRRAVDQYHSNAALLPLSSKKRSTQIIEEVSAYCGLGVLDLKSSRRSAQLVWPRQVGMWLCKRFTLDSLPEIGRRFGGRDHTTVLHSCRKIQMAADAVSNSDDSVAGWLAVFLPKER